MRTYVAAKAHIKYALAVTGASILSTSARVSLIIFKGDNFVSGGGRYISLGPQRLDREIFI